jgi:glycosyltransferase involved in cell wall biosynthesis
VHAPFAKRYLEAYGCRTPVFVVPHPPVETLEALRAADRRGHTLRAAVTARGARSLIVAAGDLNEAKQLGAVAAAVARLDPGVHLAVVGRRVPTHDAEAELRGAGLGERLRIHADTSDVDFLGWLAAADVVVDLRYPHRGEVSGTLARAMQVGRATIVSGTGTYLDEPDGTVVTVAAGPADPEEVAASIRHLLDDDAARHAIADAARDHMERLRASDATARGYAGAIEATAQLVHDPVAVPMQRWARSLVEIGMTGEHLSRGWGRRYARALESFKRSS